MKVNRLHNLTTQQIGWFLIVALVPLIIMGSVALILAKEAITEEILNDLTYVSDIRKHQVKNFFAERRYHLLNIAQSGQLISLFRQHQQDRLEHDRLLKDNPALTTLIQQWGMKNLVLISLEGKIISDLNQPNAVGLWLHDEFYSNSVLSRSYDEALERETISSPHHAYFEPYDRFSTFITSPVRDYDKIIGMVAAEVDMKRLNLVLNPTGQINSLARSGLLLASSNDNGVSLLHLDWELPQPSESCIEYRRNHLDELPMIRALNGEHGAGWSIDTACEPILVTWLPMPDLNLGMTLFKTEDDALATVEHLRIILFRTGSVAVLFALILAFFVSLPLIRPLLQLTLITRKVSKGESLNQALAELPGDIRINEIRELSESIGKMLVTIENHTHDLEEYQENLEHHVYYRTSALKKSQFAAEEANRSKSEFLARMSHEIRTPLNAIVGLSELLSESDLNKKQRRYAEALSTSSRHLTELLNNILDFSKIEANEFTLHATPFSLSEIIQQVSTIVQMDAEQKGLQYNYLIQPSIPDRLVGDTKVFRQVLLNLLSNAVKYTDQGRIDLVLTLEIEGTYEITLRVRVSDTGRGIPLDAQQNLFTAFTRLDDEAEDAPVGTGLGLTITQSLVVQMGGEIWFQSSEDQGSEFFILLPLKVAQDEPTLPAPIILPSLREQQHYTILLADDSPVNRMVIEDYLADSNFLIISANNGEEAVQYYIEHTVDLVLMDIRMPKMNGLEATRQIRSYEHQHQIPATPIIAMSADVLQETIDKAIESGCTEWLPKPTTKDKVVALIKNLLNPDLTPDEPPSLTTVPQPSRDTTSMDPLTVMYLQDSLEKLDGMNRDLQRGKLEHLSETAHAIKGNALILGFDRMGKLMKEVQEQAQLGELETIPHLLDQFRQQLDEIEGA